MADLRVMTWNIRNGGRDRAGVDRLDRIVEVIAEHRPDVLALQELRDFRRGDRLDRLTRPLGLRAHLVGGCFGQPVAILVRPTARVVDAGRVRRPFHHAAARITVRTDRGPLHILSVHLHPYSGGRRRLEAAWLAGVLGDPAERLSLLLGDLNTLDPWTGHAARLRRLPSRYRSRHLRRDGVTVDTRAVSRLAGAGLVDLFTSVGTGPGETAPTTGVGGAEFSGMRLDYILASSSLAGLARRCWVPRGGPVEAASDHYPVLAELALNV